MKTKLLALTIALAALLASAVGAQPSKRQRSIGHYLAANSGCGTLNEDDVFEILDATDEYDCDPTGEANLVDWVTALCICDAGTARAITPPVDLSAYAAGPVEFSLGPNDSFRLIGSDTTDYIYVSCVASVCTMAVAGYAPLTTSNDVAFLVDGETGFSATVTQASASAGLSHGSNTVNVSAMGVYLAGSYLLPSTATPASAAAACTAGQTAFDADFIYRCVATNTWKRAALSTW
jgi:hypothetical protein